MARRKMFKVAIYSDTLRSLIAERTSIRKLGPAIGYSEKTIRRGLKDGEMSLDLIARIAFELDVAIYEVAYLNNTYAVKVLQELGF